MKRLAWCLSLLFLRQMKVFPGHFRSIRPMYQMWTIFCLPYIMKASEVQFDRATFKAQTRPSIHQKWTILFLRSSLNHQEGVKWLLFKGQINFPNPSDSLHPIYFGQHTPSFLVLPGDVLPNPAMFPISSLGSISSWLTGVKLRYRSARNRLRRRR